MPLSFDDVWPVVRLRKLRPRTVRKLLGPELATLVCEDSDPQAHGWVVHTIRAEGDADTHSDLPSLLGFAGRLADFVQQLIGAMGPERVIAVLQPMVFRSWWDLSTRASAAWFPDLPSRAARIRLRQLGIPSDFEGGLNMKLRAAGKLTPTFALTGCVRGCCNVSLMLPKQRMEIMFCHHCDVHVHTRDGSLTDRLEALATRLGLEVVEGAPPLREPRPKGTENDSKPQPRSL